METWEAIRARCNVRSCADGDVVMIRHTIEEWARRGGRGYAVGRAW